jgi:ABC-type transport system involved in cytochrome c biogenesis permease subunit
MENLVILSAITLCLFAVALKRRFSLLIAGLGLAFLLVKRTLVLGYPPLFSPFDSIVTFVALLLISAYFLRAEPSFAGGLAAVLLTLTLFLPHQVKEIPPIVRTPLFIVHVSSAMLSYSLFGVGALFSLWNLGKKGEGRVKSEELLKWGFFLFSFSLWVGALWAFTAWGDLFPLEPKSLFSLAFWLYAAFTLHATFDPKLKRFTDALSVGCGAFVLFLFLGINFLFGGSHGF